MRAFTLLFVSLSILIVLMVSGCDVDKDDFQKAKAKNTESSYILYVANHPDGKYVAEATKLQKACAINQSLKDYNNLKDQAVSEEVAGNWSKAMELWVSAQEKVREDYMDQSTELKACKAESENRSKICKTVIENPAAVHDEKVSISYYYTSFKDDTTINNRRIRSVSARGSVTNNCPFSISSIEVCLTIYKQTALTINNDTGEDISRGGATPLATIEKVLFVGQPLAPGESRRFAISGKVSIVAGQLMGTQHEETSFYMPDPTYSFDIKGYKAQ